MDRLSGLVRTLSLASSFTGDKLASKSGVKYGTGKYANTQLVPQPSDCPEDPMNWPTWKKDLNLLGILFSVAMSGVLKTFLVTVNDTLANDMDITYTTVSTLTGVPLMISALTGILSLVVSQSVGKRSVYLGSAVLIFVGTMWNMQVGNNYSQFMGARSLQGMGMGAFDTVVLSSIQDMYFEHERGTRTAFYNTVKLTTTWGAPILVGYLAQSAGGIKNQFMIISIFQSFGIFLLITCCQETSFFRSHIDSFPSKSKIETAVPNSQRSKFSSYIRSLHPMPYYVSPSISLIVQPLRHLAAPTTTLLFIMSGLLPAIAFAISNSLSLLYSTTPMMLFSTQIGYLFTLPLILSFLIHFLITTLFTSTSPTGNLPTRTISLTTNSLIYAPPAKPSPKKYLFLTIPALILGIIGLITFGLYNENHTDLNTTTSQKRGHKTTNMNTGDSSMSLEIISFLLGLAVSGGIMLQISASAYITTSTPPTSKTSVDIETGLQFWRNVLMGLLVIVVPNWVEGNGIVKMVVGAGVMQIFGVVVAVVGLSMFGGLVEMGDMLVLGRHDSQARWEGDCSFMDV